MQLNPYLMFDGQCKAAFEFYERCLGGKDLYMMTHGESPMADQALPEWRDKIMHASLTVENVSLMGSDYCPPEQYELPRGFSVSINLNDPTKAEQLFDALSENGTIQMPLQKTFWAARFGMLVDRFGIPWMINCEEAADAA
jgi:PhnB protein